jgi:hypothetical protein
MSSPWWAAFGPADTAVTCGSGRHRVRWSEGQLHAMDHPDAEGELVLAALGGESNPCLDLIRTWGDRSDDLSVLALGPRSASDTLVFSTEVREEVGSARGNRAQRAGPGGMASMGRASRQVIARSSGGGFARQQNLVRGWSGYGRATRRPPMRHWPGRHDGADDSRIDLIWLLMLGEPFQFRLSGTVAHAWSADGQHSGNRARARPAMTAALSGRLAPAVARWLGVEPSQVDASLYEEAGRGEIERTGARLAARLPASWLARVWAPGLAVIGDHFVVGVLSAEWPAAEVLALRQPGTEPVELSVRHVAGRWSKAQ